MTERRQGRTRPGRRHRRPVNLYKSVIEESDAAVLTAAESMEGLTDEVAVLRVLLLRQLAANPDSLDLTIKGMHLLVRMVATQAQLSGEDAAQLTQRMEELANHFAVAIFRRGTADG